MNRLERIKKQWKLFEARRSRLLAKEDIKWLIQKVTDLEYNIEKTEKEHKKEVDSIKNKFIKITKDIGKGCTTNSGVYRKAMEGFVQDVLDAYEGRGPYGDQL